MRSKNSIYVGQQVSRRQRLTDIAQVVTNDLPRSAQRGHVFVAEGRVKFGCRADVIRQPSGVLPGGQHFARSLERFDLLPVQCQLR